MASPLVKLFSIFLIIISLFTPPALSVVPEECQTETNGCTNKEKALPLKLIAIFSILIASVIGVCSPLFTRSIPALHPDRNLFVIVKCFAAGIILATGFMHVLPDSFDMLSSSCLKENPWHKFPFTGFVAMLSAIVTLMVDSMATSIYSKKCSSGVIPEGGPAIGEGQHEMTVVNIGQSHGHGHYHGPKPAGNLDQQLLRYRVIAMVLELGIVVHSVVIGLSLGASNNTCTIRGLVAALCFHQMFEGMGLGGCILQVIISYKLITTITSFYASELRPHENIPHRL
ncbi:hypothetical protein QUC31_012557, partial [Theobroma cacao]